MENLAADFIIDFNNPIEAEFELTEGGFDCSFELFASGTVWGSISGTLSNQTDLQAALDLKADKTELNSAVSELNTAIQNEAATRAENDTLLQNNINTLSQTVTDNYNTLDGKIDTEISNRTAADTTLQNNIDAEALARQNADATLQGNIDTLSDTVSDNYTDLDDKISDLTDTVNDNDTAINNKVDGINTTLTNSINSLSNTVTSNYNSLDARITTNADNITTNAGNITTINSKIPNQATSSNQLADKSFVNSSIATNTANFIGTFNSVAELEAYTGTLTNNDYAFVATTDAAGNTLYDRYKYNADTQEWLFEYELNNSSFTAQQWASINSGATSTNIGQITTNANNIADLQTNKQDVLTAGTNVQINNNVISATDTTYTAGTGISIVNGVISNTQTSAEWGNIQGTLSNQTDLQNALDAKQNTISDLLTIRSGATLGATALQPNDNITELVNNAGYITSSALNGYATESFVTSQGYITGITSSDVTTALGYTPQEQLVSGTNIKTINNNSILGSGNLVLDGLPSQTGQSGKFLTTNGTNASWADVSIDILDYIAAGDNISFNGEIDASQWTAATEIVNLGSHSWRNLAYDGMKFVALSGSGYVSTSTDGTTWTAAVQNANLGNTKWYALSYDGTKFVALNRYGYISTSTDGTTWTTAAEIANLSENYWTTLSYDGTKFVALSFDGYISTSTDGTTWTAATEIANLGDNSWQALSYDGTNFVALGMEGYISTSTDGTTWTAATQNANLGDNTWYALSYDGTKFVALSATGYISTSTDGTTWTAATEIANLGDNDWFALSYDGTKFVALGSSGHISTASLPLNPIIISADDTAIDNLTITQNSSDELQAIGVIDNNSGNAIKTWTGTKAQYDAIVTKDATTLYNITDDTDTTLSLLELLFPVGAVYFGTMSTCPLQTLGVGTWQALPSDKVIQIAGTRGSVGDTLNESLPNITGEMYAQVGAYALGQKTGVFSNSYLDGTQRTASQSGAGGDLHTIFNASLSSSTYQDNAPVQQDAYLLNGWRRIA